MKKGEMVRALYEAGKPGDADRVAKIKSAAAR
jgi:hypothetical protein